MPLKPLARRHNESPKADIVTAGCTCNCHAGRLITVMNADRRRWTEACFVHRRSSWYLAT